MTICDRREHVFILGSARSGTSLLASIIQNSPTITSYHAETKLLRGCEQKYGRLTSSYHRDMFLKDWLNSRQYKRSGLSKSEVISLLECNQSYIYFLAAYMNKVAENQGCDRWIDSTPDNLYRLDLIVDAFPNAKIIHMIRDGRAVALSLAKLDWSGVKSDDFTTKLLYSGLKWQTAINKVRNMSEKIKDRYFEVRYEEFVENPETKIKEICRFLQIPSIDDVAIKRDAAINSYSTLHTPNTPFSDLSAGISTAAVSRWKSVLSSDQIHILEAYIYKTLLKMGYELVTGGDLPIAGIVRRETRKLDLYVRDVLKERTILGRLSASPLEIGMD